MVFNNIGAFVETILRQKTSLAYPELGLLVSFGYKLHVLCGLSGVIHSYDLSRASVQDITYLKDIKSLYRDCSIFGDKEYIGTEVQLDLFEAADIGQAIKSYSSFARTRVYTI